MTDFLNDLPAVLVMGTLCGIFWSLLRKNRSPQVRLWVAGWTLIFVRFVVMALPHDFPWGRQIAATIAMSSMLLAGFAFVISVSPVLGKPRGLKLLLVQLGSAGLLFPALFAFDVASPWPYVLCVAAIFCAPAMYRYMLGPAVNSPAFAVAGIAVAMVATALIFYGTTATVNAFGRSIPVSVLSPSGEGSAPLAFQLTLAMVYGAGVIRFWRAYPRFTPGTLATMTGFGGSALVWLAVMLFPGIMAVLGRDHELWNAPKYIMAFGMIVLLLETETHAARESREREAALNRQMQRFADVTSRLLSGVDVRGFCNEVAEVIIEATTFSRCTILIGDEHQQVQLAGHAGLDPAIVEQVRTACARLTLRELNELTQRGRLLGRSAVVVSAGEAEQVHAVRSGRRYSENLFWSDGDELIVPLRSHRGTLVGLISLDDPQETERVTREEMSKVEMLAADLAVAIENTSLQRQVVQSEKLASIGQLVAGVAHELNNPLTAVLGYAELLGDRTADEKSLKELDIIRRESLRMKGIISNLQRFAQQVRTETAETALRPLLDEVYRSRINDLYARGVELVPEFGPGLPKVSINGTQLKQVLMNLIANSVDAIGDRAGGRVRLAARATANSAVISVIDNGPGFSDVTRAFDPFFTTKSPGKGIGLGLSICYGVVKQHGGTISAQNMSPSGACVTIELPAVGTSEAAAVPATAD